MSFTVYSALYWELESSIVDFLCAVVEKDPHQPLCHHSVGESEPFISSVFRNGQVTHIFQSPVLWVHFMQRNPPQGKKISPA